ncbi:hypothetical protein TNCV_2163051 [Trichonephila clavipes]|nr:hypothetical protein TNCV_2163051 [Trichonephila clavipes]
MHTTGHTLTHTLSVLIHINSVSASMRGPDLIEFDRTISFAKVPGWRNVSGIFTRVASSSTVKCSSQHKGLYVVPTRRITCTFQRRCVKCMPYSVSRVMDWIGWSGKLAGMLT